MTFLPSVIRADFRGGFRIRITFNDLLEGTLGAPMHRGAPATRNISRHAYYPWPVLAP
ncbi:MAG TPA: hypothetical protein VKO18_02745 [Terriglobia bacterium]|nr:hypothetical protein [Terriglobia bacterium]